MDRPTPPDSWSQAPGSQGPGADPVRPDAERALPRIEAPPRAAPRSSLRGQRDRGGSLRSDARRLDPRGAGLSRFDSFRREAAERASATFGRAGTTFGPGGLRINPLALLVSAAIVFAIFYISWAIFKVRDVAQIPMLSTGFLVLGLAFAVIAVSAAIRMWRAAERARTGRAMLLAVGGGLFGLAAIGCLTLTVLFALVWRS
jgi:hypothetical protein